MNMVSQASRDLATRRVMKALAMQGNHNHVRDDQGHIPVVIAFPNESAEDVFRRVAEVGHAANVALCFATTFRLLRFRQTIESAESDAVNNTMSIGMLAIHARGRKGRNYQLKGASVSSSTRDLAYAR